MLFLSFFSVILRRKIFCNFWH